LAEEKRVNESEPLWYAFVTRPRHEKKAKIALDGEGIENFLPLKKSLHQWKDRRRWVEEPLFSCYIFVRIAYNRRWDVQKSASVVRIVSFLAKPAPVRDAEIETIRRILTTEVDVEVQPGLLPGTQVRIGSGPLAGLEGKFIGLRGQKWFVVHIPAIGKSVLVNMGENIVEAV
jgi:transcriptional antiterminator RfaH